MATQAKGRAGLTSSMGGGAARPITGANQDASARPMTAVRAAGYTSVGNRGKIVILLRSIQTPLTKGIILITVTA